LSRKIDVEGVYTFDDALEVGHQDGGDFVYGLKDMRT
jgi:hypothetical protein